jgi:hypothetical protein
MVIELQEQLFAKERELDSWESALTAREDNLAASEYALGRVCVECDAECDRATAVRQDYRARLSASTEVQPPMNHFKKLLEETCLNHAYPIKHKLKDWVKLGCLVADGVRGGNAA